MLKGYRGSLLALFLSLALLALVVLTRPAEAPRPTPTNTPHVTSEVTIVAAIPPTPTPAPTLTPAPVIPIQQIDTAVFTEAIITPDCFVKLNPLLAGYNNADRDATALIFEGLMKIDQYGAAVPALAAKSPRISSDGLTYVVELRQDVRWHDGEPFTSADVLFTINLMQDSAFAGPVELNRFWRTVEIDALDTFTVRFKLAQPLATFLDYLRVGIVPEHALRGTRGEGLRTHPFNLSPIGTGAYQFGSLIGDGARLRGVRLRAAPVFKARPEGAQGYAFHTLNLRCYPSWDEAIAAFQRGEVNAIGEIPAIRIQEIAALPLVPNAAYRPALGAVIFNWARDSVPFFRDQRMRRALALSLDRKALVETHLRDRAIVAETPILPSSWAYAPGVVCPNFDPNGPNAAQESLSLVQITPPPPENADTPAGYHFELLVVNDAGLAGMASAMSETWKLLGISVNVVVVDATTFRERLNTGGFDAALVELNLAPSADPDPYSLWRQLPQEGGLNFGSMNDRLISELIEQARRADEGSLRVRLYQEFQKLFCDRAAALVLYYPVYYYGADARIEGIQSGFMSESSDRYRTLQDWRFAIP